MAKLILHIGMPKTGSTAIQAALSMSSGDFVYPRLGSAPHHTDALLQLFSSQSGLLARKKDALGKPFTSRDGDGDKIARAAATANTVILSSEALLKYLSIDDMTALKCFADKLFDRIEVVAYVREPFGLASASFWTSLKAGRLSRFVFKYQPYRPLSDFDTVFGRSNVRLWKYSTGECPNVVEHFSTNLGLELMDLPWKNVTVSRPAASAVYRLNRAFRQGEELPYKLAQVAVVNCFPHKRWPKFRLSKKLIEPLIDLDDLAWIEERLGSSLRNEGDPQEHDVTSEQDMLDIDPEALKTLRCICESLEGDARNLLERALASSTF